MKCEQLEPVKIIMRLFLLAVVIYGCATPNLKPFADATSTLSRTVKKGGDMVIAQVTGKTVVVNGQTFEPDHSKHPVVKLKESWELRKKTMDALIVYSASLAAIADASAKRQSNATAVVSAVKELALTIPGLNIGSNAAGDLIIYGLSLAIEVKAYHDMAEAVKSAHPAVELIAKALGKDMEGLPIEFQNNLDDEIQEAKKALWQPLKYYNSLIKERTEFRRSLPSDLDKPGSVEGMLKLDALIQAVEPEVNRSREKIAALQNKLDTGLKFYEMAQESIQTWVQAHQDIQKAFTEKRAPNLVLLAARAQELKGLIEKFEESQD